MPIIVCPDATNRATGAITRLTFNVPDKAWNVVYNFVKKFIQLPELAQLNNDDVNLNAKLNALLTKELKDPKVGNFAKAFFKDAAIRKAFITQHLDPLLFKFNIPGFNANKTADYLARETTGDLFLGAGRKSSDILLKQFKLGAIQNVQERLATAAARVRKGAPCTVAKGAGAAIKRARGATKKAAITLKTVLVYITEGAAKLAKKVIKRVH